MDIQIWIESNKGRFGSPFERIFAERVLVGVEGLDLDTVSLQYPFRDLDNMQRYCDFVIHEGGIHIAIEIDGYNKRNNSHGMSHDEFVDWQRRQAALTASGWHVLRFANRDVLEHPDRCRRYIELLLRDQRSKSQHQISLETAILQISKELDSAKCEVGTAGQAGHLAQQIRRLKNQLALAQAAQPLSEQDRQEMTHVVSELEQENRELKSERLKIEKHSKAVTGENSTMRTTIWAFTIIIGMLIGAGAYAFREASQADTAAVTAASMPVAVGRTCDAPVDLRSAANFVGQRVAVLGTVAEYTYLPRVNGSPTWINLGAKYPSIERVSVVIWGSDRASFGRALSGRLVNRSVCVMGTVNVRKGVLQIVISDPHDLVFK